MRKDFSQLYAKVSIPDIYLIPIQANNAGEGQGVSFQFNDTVTKIGRKLNARRNTRFLARDGQKEYYSAIRLFRSPTNERFQSFQSFVDFFIKHTLLRIFRKRDFDLKDTLLKLARSIKFSVIFLL
jgi:hypothetical protein